jgi:hypothetical protein
VTRRYRLESGGPEPFPAVECVEADGPQLLLRFDGKDILRFNAGTVTPPEGVDRVFERSGHIHPVRTPDGRVISNDMPAKHLHHHGIWSAWQSAEVEGRKIDFWNSAEKQGKVECVRVEATWSGPVFGGFRARLRHLDLKAPGGPTPALEETWDVRVWAMKERFLFDLQSVQTCLTASPVVLREYHYGGFGFRGPEDWEGAGGVTFLTSEGKGRIDGHGTTSSWCLMTGMIGGKDAAIGFFCHPSSFRAPQGMRLHPDEPFFCWAPVQGGDFEIAPGTPLANRYRFVVAGGALGADEMNRLWAAFADPPRSRAIR